MSDERFAVRHRPDESRYVLLDLNGGDDAPREIGEEAYVDLASDERNERILFHTFVSDAYAGQGLGSVLVRGAVEDAVDAGYAIVPVCPFVAAWLPKHPEFAEHAVEPRPEHLRAAREAQR